MPESTAALLERAIATVDNQWTLQHATSDHRCSLACGTDGWTLSLQGGEFSVTAEGTYRNGQDASTVAAFRLRLQALGWTEPPAVRLRRKPDRRRE